MPATSPIGLSLTFKGYTHGFSKMRMWCENNCKGKYYTHGTERWSFEDEEDALAFKLKWG